MNAKEYLRQAYGLDVRIQSDLRELEELRSLASCVGSPGFERGNNPNRPTEANFVKSLERIWEMEDRVNAEIDRMMKTKEEIRSVIDQVENFDQQMLLRYRYLHHYSWETIAETMHFGTRWLHVLHGRALNSVDSILRFRNLE